MAYRGLEGISPMDLLDMEMWDQENLQYQADLHAATRRSEKESSDDDYAKLIAAQQRSNQDAQRKHHQKHAQLEEPKIVDILRSQQAYFESRLDATTIAFKALPKGLPTARSAKIHEDFMKCVVKLKEIKEELRRNLADWANERDHPPTCGPACQHHRQANAAANAAERGALAAEAATRRAQAFVERGTVSKR
jgi:hypothetical protein